MTKMVYNPENDKSAKPAKQEKPTEPKTEKSEAKAAKSGETKKPKIEQPKTPKRKTPKASEMVGDILEFEIPKGVNAYGFIHIAKKALDFLPFPQQVALKAKIDPDAKTLTIRKA